jgi:hypothetical protein
MVTRVVGRFAAAGAGTAAGAGVLAYGVALLSAHPGRPAAAWLAGGAALVGAGLALLDRQNLTSALVANLGGAAGLLVGGVTWLVVSIVTLVQGGDRAGPVGAFGIGCAVTAGLMALSTAYSDPEEIIDLLPGWIAAGMLGFAAGLFVVAFYQGLHGQPWAFLALLPGVGCLLAALLMFEDVG